jgi:peptidoglycan/LPS O-acetylase OafA/YrhL
VAAADAPSFVRLPYLAGLDGLRGFALIAVLLTHAEFGWVRGGHVALTAFFTLSGFLITALLLGERYRTGTVGLRTFWTRRARRLVPALLMCFPLVALVVLLNDIPPSDGLALDALAAMTWVANWRFVLDGQDYGDLFALPSPFQHFWSLAVEEQFYLFFPLLLISVLGVRHARPRTNALIVLLGILVVVSTAQAALLFEADGPLGRAYYGTDARLAELLVGALLAAVLVGPRGLCVLPASARMIVHLLGGAGFAGLVGMLLFLDKSAPLAYRGGFLLGALCTAAVVAACTQPASPVRTLLSWRPLVSLGLISYGVYLFHWPLFLLLTERSTGLGPVPLLAVRFAAVVALAALSYRLVETPVRQGLVPARPALGAWATGAVSGLVVVAAAVAAVTSVPSTVPPPFGGVQAAAPSVSAASVPRAFQLSAADLDNPEVPQPHGDVVRVAVVGDSVGNDLGIGLANWAAARDDVQVVNFAIPGCPLTRGGERRTSRNESFPVEPFCSWWSAAGHQRRVALEQFDPDVVVAQFGLNEVFDRRLPGWSEWLGPGDPRFDQWLVEEYRTAVAQWSAGGARVALLNAPCADWDRHPAFQGMDDADTRVLTLNARVYQRVTDVMIADLFGRICPKGRYHDAVEGVPDGRFDGVHFTEQATTALVENWLAERVLEAARG